MSRRIPSLNALRMFEAASRHLSFTKAAEELSVTQGAVSRQIRVLEQTLGFELFERTPRGVELTRAGATYAATLTDAFERIARATDEIATVTTHSALTIRGYTTFLVRWLAPRLPDFHAKHPNIDVRLVSASDSVDFSRDKVDLGIRYGHGSWPGLVSDRLFGDELFPVCRPSVLQEAGLRTPADLRKCTLLHLMQRRNDWTDWFAAAGEAPASAKDEVLDDLGVALECTLAGQGVLMGQRSYVASDILSGRLAAPFEPVLRRTTGYYLVCPRERAGLTKVSIFRNWLTAHCARTGDIP